MKIKNNYHKTLSFSEGDWSFSIGPGEVKDVNEKEGRLLLVNPWIKEVFPETAEKKISALKGRAKIKKEI